MSDCNKCLKPLHSCTCGIVDIPNEGEFMQTCNMDERTNDEIISDQLILRYKMAVMANLSSLGSNATRKEVYKAVDDAFKEDLTIVAKSSR